MRPILVSSHLSVTYQSNAGATATKALGASQDDAGAAQGIMGLFAALLGGNEPAIDPTDDTAQTTQASQANVDISLGDLIRIKLDAGSGDAKSAGDDTGETDAIPTVDPSTVVIQQGLANLPTPAQQPVADLIGSLTELDGALARGQIPPADLLDTLSQQLDAVRQTLGLADATQPDFEALLAQANAMLPADATTDQQLSQKLAALALNLRPSTVSADQGATLSTSQTDVANTLAALAKALGDGAVPAATLKKLGLDTTTASTDPALKAAITDLVKPAGAQVVANAEPVLATALLAVNDTALVGKTGTIPAAKADTATVATTDTATTATTSATTTLTPVATKAVTAADPGDRQSSDGNKDKKSDAQAIAAAVAGKFETRDDSPAATGAQTMVQAPPRTEAAATARPAPTVYQTNQQQINVPQIAFEMVRQAQHGNSRFQIRLDPPELGRIDVHLDIDGATGVVNARMMVERSETLDLMQRDQRSLQQALQQAGLDGSKTNLEFSLRQNNSGQHNPQHPSGGGASPVFGSEIVAEDTIVPTVKLYRGSLSASGVNILA